MHKYQPRVHIIKKKDHTASLLNLKSEEFRTFIFPETVFTAVTAYQNQLVSIPFTIYFPNKIRLQESYLLGEKGYPSTQNRNSLWRKLWRISPRTSKYVEYLWLKVMKVCITPSFLEPLYSWSGCSLLPCPTQT